MKVRKVEALRLAGSGAQGAYGAPYGFLVKITGDDGLVGWGEADTLPALLQPVIEAPVHDSMMGGLAAILEGREAGDIAGAWQAMAEGTANCGRDGLVRIAMAAVDIALWDLRGKAEGRPVHALLGTRRHDSLAYYASHPLGETVEETAGFGRMLKALGVPAAKLGWWPLGQSEAGDEAIVAVLREALGPDTGLLIDGGIAFDADGAIRRSRMMGRYGVHWFEEPLKPYDLDGYRRLRRVSPVRIAAGEMAATYEELARLIASGGIDVVQIDLSRVGITEALRVAETAERHGVACVNHTYTLDWNLAASLHLMAVLPEVDLLEYQVTPNAMRDALVRDRPLAKDGRVAVPHGPGLGVEPDPEMLARFLV